MIPALSYADVELFLNQESFQTQNGFAKGLPSTANTVGFVLFDQNFDREPVADVVRNLDMLNQHSDTSIHFFLCGISKFGRSEGSAKKVGVLDNTPLFHNASAALSFAREFERRIPGWNYNLGFDLILIDVKSDDEYRTLDFDKPISFRVEELIRIEVIERPTELFGKLIKFARDGEFESAARLRNHLREVFGLNWFKGLVVTLFPKAVGKLARAEAVLRGGYAQAE
ncbi:hypothetical protein [Maricaulis maris]|uniref:hypothetical protein n=1 Tax=Maricaulis maris TaxID=74318 RepID=UPI0026F12835|nr:hypothetical protein [Maricaulis maris]